MGSVAQRLLLRAPCAVLVIRPGAGAALEGWLGGGRRLQVVVGIDRRGRATDAALDWARQLGDLGPCDLTLVHEYWPPAEYRRLGMRGPRDLFETDPEVAGILQRELEAKVGTLAWAPNATLRVRAAWGPIGEALAREAEAVRADLIVVGSEQPHGWRRVRRGSIAVSALHAAPVLLLSVPERTGTTVTGEAPLVAPPLRSILAATDLSEPGNAAVAHAFSLLRAEGGVVHLCHVCEHALPSPPYAYAPAGEGLSGAHRSAVEAGLQALVPPEAAEIGIEARVVVVDGGDPATEVVAAAARLGADAIVIASHGRSGVKRAVLGSAAEAVLRASEIPVYVVPRRRGDGP
jgi:nucleotide-binding universal stress UspA family protein